MIEADYVNSELSLKALAEKYGVPLGSVQKHSAKGKWSEKRQKYSERKAEKVSRRVNDKAVNQTVREINRIMKAAGKLIDKINRAINQLERSTYISHDEKDITTREDKPDESTEHVNIVKNRKMKTATMKTDVDTKRVLDLTKSLATLKEIFTGDNGQPENNENSGVIEISAATAIDPRKEENEEDMDAAAETGVYDVEVRG